MPLTREQAPDPVWVLGARHFSREKGMYYDVICVDPKVVTVRWQDGITITAPRSTRP